MTGRVGAAALLGPSGHLTLHEVLRWIEGERGIEQEVLPLR